VKDSSPGKRNALRRLAAGLAAVSIVGGVIFAVLLVPVCLEADEMLTRHKEAFAEITKEYSSGEDLQFADYKYWVASKVYTGHSEIGLRPVAGQSLLVFFVNDDPSFSSLYPKATAERLRRLTILAASFVAILAVCALWVRARYLDRAPSHDQSEPSPAA